MDAGGSCKALCEALSNMGCAPTDIAAVAITHEHTDHINALKTFLKKSGAKLIASSKTIEAIAAQNKLPEGVDILVADSGEVSVGDMTVSRFETSHDCEGSSGYGVSAGGKKIAAVCTDLGVVTDTVRNSLCGYPAVVIESNHDVDMLKRGPYPPLTKLRILSEHGHLSNNACACELEALLKGGTSRFILAHLSRNNNLPMLARSAAVAALADAGAKEGADYLLTVAKPCQNGVIPL